MNSSLDYRILICAYIYTAWNVLYVLFLPVFMSVIYIGLQQWRKPQTQSRSSGTNHSDIFTFNLATLDIFGVLGTCILTGSFFSLKPDMGVFGDDLIFMALYGQILFHNLICMERYLAVVHPITYLRMKKNGKVIRNICIFAVWLVSACMVFVYHFRNALFNFLSVLIIAVISLVSISFFSANVLCVLTRPAPGERGGYNRQIDQSKHRAFYTMMSVTVALMLKFGLMFASYMVYLSKTLDELKLCIFSVSVQWMNIPSSVVPPLLILHRQIILRQKS